MDDSLSSLRSKSKNRQHYDNDDFIIHNDYDDDFVQNNPLANDYHGRETELDSSDAYADINDFALSPSHSNKPVAGFFGCDDDHQQPQQPPMAEGGGCSPPPSVDRHLFTSRYLGSVRLPEGELIGDKSLSTMTHCILNVANASKKSSKVIYELKENRKVVLALEGRELKVTTDDKEAKVILCHPLNMIRAWAVGKETKSHHFAYVMRGGVDDDAAGCSHVCRVFKCSVEAHHVTSALRNVCQKRAEAKAAAATAIRRK